METTRDINRALVNGIPFLAEDESDTDAFARAFAERLSGGEVISLEGELGAGKTFFSRSLSRRLGIGQPVTSPTFVIQKIYEVPGHGAIEQLIHYDLYRIGCEQELFDLGFDEPVPNAVTLVEWGNLFPNAFGAKPVRVEIQKVDEDSRLITVDWAGGNQI